MFANPEIGLNDFAINAGGWTSFDQYPRQVADINGDGNADIIRHLRKPRSQSK